VNQSGKLSDHETIAEKRWSLAAKANSRQFILGSSSTPADANMQTTALTKVTIIAEAVLRERLIQDVLDAGATGYTCSQVEGEGSRHIRSGDLPGENVRLETIVNDAVADRLLARLSSEYFPHFALIAYLSEVRVIRGEKYV